MKLIASLVLGATLTMSPTLLAQQSQPAAGTTQMTPAPESAPMTKAEMKAQRKQQKAQEKSARENAKAASEQSKAVKHQDKATDAAEKAGSAPPATPTPGY